MIVKCNLCGKAMRLTGQKDLGYQAELEYRCHKCECVLQIRVNLCELSNILGADRAKEFFENTIGMYEGCLAELKIAYSKIKENIDGRSKTDIQ